MYKRAQDLDVLVFGVFSGEDTVEAGTFLTAVEPLSQSLDLFAHTDNAELAAAYNAVVPGIVVFNQVSSSQSDIEHVCDDCIGS